MFSETNLRFNQFKRDDLACKDQPITPIVSSQKHKEKSMIDQKRI